MAAIEETVEYIKNPVSGRLIKIGGLTFNSLIRRNIVACPPAPTAHLPPPVERLPPPPEGFKYRKTKSGFKLVEKCVKFGIKNTLRHAAIANLRYKNEEMTEESIKAEVDRIMASSLECSLGVPKDTLKRVKPTPVTLPPPAATLPMPKPRARAIKVEASTTDISTSAQESDDYYSSESDVSQEDEPTPVLQRSKSALPVRKNATRAITVRRGNY